MSVQVLETLTLPLFGERLIEASAGTGKTYTLAALYLRLLLGLGNQSAYCRPLAVEEILVVTFTEAATEELRNRIRENIHALRVACVRGNSSDALLNQLLTQIPDHQVAANVLLLAERQMDEAAIYTIHGFCQRMLVNNAFESGVLFEQQLIQDQQALYRQAAADFWRRYCYPLPFDIVQVVVQEWAGPEALLKDIAPYLQGDIPQLTQPPSDLIAHHQQIIQRIDHVKQQWQQDATEIEALIIHSGVDKRSYSSRNLPNWLAAVTQWSTEETQSYALPKALASFAQSQLLEKTKKGIAPEHPLFVLIEQLYQQPLTLRPILLNQAIHDVRNYIQLEKYRRAELGFDDLLSRLDFALAKPEGRLLADSIRQRYPVAMIDEFQDTDPQQYRIFKTIYANQPDSGLLLIGDPKQAIYSFRGADIFTYIQAKSHITHHYTMDTNWRSAKPMVESVNHLFQRLAAPFIFSQIPYLPVHAADKNHSLSLNLHNTQQSAMQFWLLAEDSINISEYQRRMAEYCAGQIRDWLMQPGWLDDGKNKRAVTAHDIAILVRTGHEAEIMRQALAQLAIPSVYLSNRDSVFSTVEAQDILWILQAVLAPQREQTLRTALACGVFGQSAAQIDELNCNEDAWNQLVDEFSSYQQCWLKRGVLPMLRDVMAKRRLAENLLATPGGERRLTDFMHISELLQEASLELESEHALVRWLAQQIMQPNLNVDNQQLRLESDQHLVRIVTIHKSKGLEYPLVCLPFICTYRSQKQALYHDRQNFTATLDLNASDEAIKLAEEERLAEDLRLLYVAMTRAIYHCCIGVAPLTVGNRRSSEVTDLHQSALGYLLQRGQPGSRELLNTSLDELTALGIAVKTVEPSSATVWQSKVDLTESLVAKQFKRQLNSHWRVTSYSELQQGSSRYVELLPNIDVDSLGEKTAIANDIYSAQTFPKGAAAGTFLHNLLEQMDFTQPISQLILQQQMQQEGIDEVWQPTLQQWLTQIVATPLNQQGLALNQIASKHKQAELQFYLPIQAQLTASALDQLMSDYDPLSARAPSLSFSQVQGMLKGFIDLVFHWQGRYYIADYKSNWLSDYSLTGLEQAMIEHRYDLQYQLYSLALHRYLRHRITDYDYQRHFGGVFYLFLRGMEPNKPQQGIFYHRPEWALLDGLDQLFTGDKA